MKNKLVSRIHYAPNGGDYARCGMDIRRGGWTTGPQRVTCASCLSGIAKDARERREERR